MAGGATTKVRDRRARMAGYAVFFVTGLLFATLVTRVPALQARFGLTEGELTLVLALVPVVAGLGSVLAALLIPRVGSAAILRPAQPALALAVVGVGAAPSLPWLYPAVGCVGLLLGAVDAAMNTQAVGVERRFGKSLLTGFHGVWSVGAILGSLWASHTADRGDIPLVAALGAAAVLGVAVTVSAGPFLHSGLITTDATGDAGGPGTAGGDAASRVPWRPVLLLGIALCVVFLADSAVSTWSAVYLSGVVGAVALAPLGYAAYQATTVVGRAGGDFAVRAYGAPAVVRTGAVVAAAGLLLVVLAQGPVLALTGFALTGLGASVVIPTSFSAAGALDPEGTGTAVARLNIFNYVGFVLGAVLIGTVAELLDLRAAFAAPLVLILAVLPLARHFAPEPPPNRLRGS